ALFSDGATCRQSREIKLPREKQSPPAQLTMQSVTGGAIAPRFEPLDAPGSEAPPVLRLDFGVNATRWRVDHWCPARVAVPVVPRAALHVPSGRLHGPKPPRIGVVPHPRPIRLARRRPRSSSVWMTPGSFRLATTCASAEHPVACGSRPEHPSPEQPTFA